MQDENIFLKDMSWPEIKDRLTKTDIAIIPAGQTEQHGKHLPINVDNIICTGIAQRVAEATYETAKPVVAPTIPFGYSDIPYFRDYPGVFSLKPETLTDVYEQVAFSLVRMGFKKIIFINGHHPNPPFIQEAMRRVTKKSGAFTAMANFFEIPQEEVLKILEEQGQPPVWGHACLIETSVSEVFGAKVREEFVEESYMGEFPKELKDYVPLAPIGINVQSYEYNDTARAYWPADGNGPMGIPVGHSKEIGERVIAATINPIVELVNSIASLEVKIHEEYLEKRPFY
ncbi:creatininase family protein [Miniphocaeibacter halophilus]|uniref:Creatininase family protein n=1 Tax=Miniphocaeibacter halophilus TaxID=2931922 RepID=A0AC61MX07_9FIRM|nr:creatininase family protein [Miniphocaeibacter halophilus]QQK08266.1 creatininase family protein [Miniphocaeibacter halophilus]